MKIEDDQPKKKPRTKLKEHQESSLTYRNRYRPPGWDGGRRVFKKRIGSGDQMNEDDWENSRD